MLVLHRLVPPRAAAPGRSRRGRARAGRTHGRAARADARRAAGQLRVLRLPTPPARLRELGRMGGTRAGAGAAPAETDVPVRARARPQRGAGRRCGAPGRRGRAAGGVGARRGRAVYGRPAAVRERRGRAGGRARAGRGAADAGQQPGHRRALPDHTARARCASCISAPICSTLRAHHGASGPPDARDGRASGGAQAPCRRAARAGGARAQAPDAAL